MHRLVFRGGPWTLVWLVALGLTACAPPEPDLFERLEDGFFVPVTLGVELIGFDERTVEDPAAGILPLRARKVGDWGVTGPFGWQPVGERVVFDLRRQDLEDSELFLDLYRVLPDSGSLPPLTVTVLLEGQDLGQYDLGVGRTSLRMSAPPELPAWGGRVELLFDDSLEERIAELRPGVALERAAFLPPGESPQRREKPPVAHLDADRRVLELPSAGSFLWPLDVAASTLVLELQVASEARAEIAQVGFEGERRVLSEEPAGGWRSVEVELGEPGRRLFLEVRVLAEGGKTEEPPVRLRSPRWHSGEELVEAQQGPTLGEVSPRPDVYLLLLDAARGDRFLDDYPRPVIPRIDEVKAEGLTFRRAYSECPSTVCSIPNMVSGLELLPMGSPSKPLRLPGDVVTLAEVLQEAGYRTVAFTSNPYNSRSRGTHQGFDDFVEMWGEPAHLMAQRAAEILAEQPAEEPLFLSLHMVPPHEPYDPTPEFDLFGDPDYSGPMTPGLSLRDFREGRMELNAEDFAEVEALYDGNLRRGDDAVGQVLDAARAAGRYRDALVLVVSDHGEAFLEHGVHGHNTTLYEEMLHIPFILRLPGGERPAEVDLDRLVALSDVVPTVLARLQLESPEGLNGVDVVASPPDPDRVLVQRIPHPLTPTWSTISARFKTLSRPHFRIQELYDLRQDPSETDDLVFEQPLLFAGFQRLRQLQQARADSRQLEGGDADLTAQEEETLRSLGYLD